MTCSGQRSPQATTRSLRPKGPCSFLYERFVLRRSMLTRQQKEQIVGELVEAVSSENGFLLVDYRDVDTPAMQDLRQRLRDAGATLRIMRKTLLKRALAQAKVPLAGKALLEGQIALAYGFTDPVAVAKAFASFRKDLETAKGPEVGFTMRAGWIDAQLLDQGQLVALARLPSRPELLARLVGSLGAPLSGLVGVLSGPERGFLQVLRAKAEKGS